MVVGVLLLQQLHDLTDAQTVAALAFVVAWHYALDVRGEADCYLCDKTLRNYRRLLIDEGLDEVLFRHLTDRLVAAFAVDSSRQRMDSTALRSALRSLTRLGIVVETIAKFVRELTRCHPDLYDQIDAGLIRRTVEREGSGAFTNTAPSASRRGLGEAGGDLLALALQFRKTAAGDLESFAILERVLADQFDIKADGDDQGNPTALVRKPEDVPCDTVANPADPDASYNAHHGLGYMVQIVETFCDDDGPDEQGDDDTGAPSPDLITHVAVHKMTVHDGHQVPDALEDLASRSITPERLLADSHYGAEDNRIRAKTQSVDLVAPARPAKGKTAGRLTLEDFTLDADGLVERCPAGHRPASVSAAKAKLQARFDLSLCCHCKDRHRCPVSAKSSLAKSSLANKRDGAFARFQYTPARAASQRRRIYESSEAFLNTYRWRAGIEATMARLKHQMNLAHLRIRGMSAMRYVVFLRALGFNIHRCAAVGPPG